MIDSATANLGLGGLYKRPVNTDKVYRSFVEQHKKVIVLNDLPNATAAERRANTELVQAIYDQDTLEDIPKCRCGTEYSVEKEGITCLKCGTTVSRVVDDDTGIVSWLRAPRHVTALINPTMMVTLQQFFSIGGRSESVTSKAQFDFLRYAMDPRYVVPPTQGSASRTKEVTRVINKFHELGFTRGYNAFIAYYDDFIDAFVNDNLFRKDSDDAQFLWIKFLNMYRDLIFVQYVPSPPPSLLVLEVTDTLTYRSARTTEAVNAVRQLLSIDTVDTKPARAQHSTMLAMFGLAKFAVDYAVQNERGKHGMWRMHVYAMRVHLASFRGVAYSLHEEHRPDEVVLPWGIFVKCMYFHLANMLDKLGYTYPEIVMKLALAVQFYDKEVDQLLQQLMVQFRNGDEFPGPMVVMIRFPTMGPGSIIAFFVSGYTLPHEGNAIGFPNTNVVSMNADYDGDKFTAWFPLDMESTRRWHDTFGAHNNVMSVNDLRTPTGNFPLPRPFTINLRGFLEDGNQFDPNKVEYMQLLVS